MSHDSSEQMPQKGELEATQPKRRFGWFRPLIGYSAWITVAFVLAYVLLYVTFWLLRQLIGPLNYYVSSNFANSLVGFVLYAYMIGILILVPRWIIKARVTRETLGIAKLPRLRDAPIAIIGMIVYFIGAALLLQFFIKYIPGFDVNQAQNLGVSDLQPGIETYLTFALLVLVGPIAEELIFRGYLYGNLKRVGTPVWLAVLVTSVLFGAAHMQWNVGVNVFVLSVAMCIAREYTGSIWAGVLMHMLKNGLAFYALFMR